MYYLGDIFFLKRMYSTTSQNPSVALVECKCISFSQVWTQLVLNLSSTHRIDGPREGRQQALARAPTATASTTPVRDSTRILSARFAASTASGPSAPLCGEPGLLLNSGLGHKRAPPSLRL